MDTKIKCMDRHEVIVRDSAVGEYTFLFAVDSGGMAAIQINKEQALEICLSLSDALGIQRELSQRLGFES